MYHEPRGQSVNAIRRAAHRTQRAVDAFLRPPWSPNGHYYSAVPSRADASRAAELAKCTASLPGIDLREAHQRDLAHMLAEKFSEVPTTTASSRGWRYDPDNDM